jgi:hypothetical protein
MKFVRLRRSVCRKVQGKETDMHVIRRRVSALYILLSFLIFSALSLDTMYSVTGLISSMHSYMLEPFENPCGHEY